MALTGVATLEFSNPDTLKKNPDNAKRKHICNVCSRAFKRSEHCIRHQRRHTQEKPFACHFCRRRYSRKDLLVRHERTLHAGEKAKANAKLSDELEVAHPKSTSNAENEVEGPKQGSALVGSPKNAEELTPASSETIVAGSKRKQPTSNRPGKRTRVASVEPASPKSTAELNGIASQRGAETDYVDQIPRDIRTELPLKHSFNSPPAFPAINADLDLLEFFDPFFGLPAEHIGEVTLPGLKGLTEGFSPLEQFTASSVSSVQGSKDLDPIGFVEPSISSYTPAHYSPRQKESSIKSTANFKPVATSIFASSDSLPIPKVRRTANPKPPTLNFTDAMRTKLREDLSKRLPSEQLADFRLPIAIALQKCLRTFVDAFHVHLPIFHLPTMDLERTPSPLILAMCAIGALYRLERKIAASLYIKADQALSSQTKRETRLEKTPNLLENWSRPLPDQTGRYRDSLWTGQTRLLLTMFASFSGDPEVMSRAIAQIGEFSLDYRRLAPSVKPRNFGVEGVTWQDWIERECVKRLLYGHIMLTNSLAMTYGMPPGYSIVSDGNIEMPGDQSLWDATNATQWYELVSVKGRSSLLSVRDAVSRIMYGSSSRGVPEECWSWSPFACTVVINAVSIQIWHVTQGSYFFDDVAGIGQTHDSEESQVLAQTEAALSRCRALITQAGSDADYTWTESEGPLLFNCLALLRVTYCRAFTGTGCADRMMLLKDSREEIVASIEEFVAMPQERDEFTSRAVARAFEGMVIPAKAGILLLRKTAALTWSVEHALAGWDAALLVTKWVHTIEVETVRGRGRVLSEREEQLIQNMADIIAEDDSIDQATSMAARLAEHWASFYDDTWVWGVTPRIGWILRELSNCYENALLSI